MAPIIRIENLHHTYNADTAQPIHALQAASLTIQPGEYVVILGHNGSGKSTLARHLNGLLLPTQGEVWVKEWNTKDTNALRAIRSTVGMVFQTPDNQIVATIVEEDVAFGPENLGIAHEEMVQRVAWSLETVDMWDFRHRAPHLLSGGQKQRVCIAGVLAMRPEVLVLDESTAMLDPLGRQQVLAIAQRLNREQGVTVIAVTHFMEEAVIADRVIVMDGGQIVMQGTPRDLFRQADRLRELHLDIPPITELALALHEQFPTFPPDLLTIEEFVQAVQQHELRITNYAPTNQPTNQPTIYLYERITAGLGFSTRLFQLHEELLGAALALVRGCSCRHGCPACVGPVLENELAQLETKQLTVAMLEVLTAKDEGQDP